MDILSPPPVDQTGTGGAAEPALLRFFSGLGCDEAEGRRLAAVVLADPAVPRDEPAAAVAHADARVRAWFAALLGRAAGPATVSGARAAFLMQGGAGHWPGALLESPPPDLIAVLQDSRLQGVPPAVPGAMLDQSLEPVWSRGRTRVRLARRGPQD